MTDSPSLLLRRAADELELAAAHFANYEEAQADEENSHESALAHWLYTNVENLASTSARKWIRMMNPTLALPLANILRDAAFTLDAHPEYRTHYLSYMHVRHATEPQGEVLGLLRRVLSGPVAQKAG